MSTNDKLNELARLGAKLQSHALALVDHHEAMDTLDEARRMKATKDIPYREKCIKETLAAIKELELP